jgi:phosphatidylserine/phosphatidylglycerophosphate/cardiolipin synthase-like enzyme
VKVLTNRPAPDLIRGLTSLLVRSLSAERGEVYLISPWLKDVRLPTGDVGSFRAALGGDPDEMPLSELLERTARRHALHVVTKPPHELIDLPTVRRISDERATRRRVTGHADLSGLDIVDELTASIDDDLRRLAAEAATGGETLRLVNRAGAAGAAVAFPDRLHAKLLWTPHGALVGSANFTNGGLVANEELMLEVTDAAAHAALLEAARAMAGRGTRAGRYRLTRDAERAELNVPLLRKRAATPTADDPPPLTEVLRLIAPFLGEDQRDGNG